MGTHSLVLCEEERLTGVETVISVWGGGAMAGHVETAIEKIVQELLVGSDLELVDVEYVKERDW